MWNCDPGFALIQNGDVNVKFCPLYPLVPKRDSLVHSKVHIIITTKIKAKEKAVLRSCGAKKLVHDGYGFGIVINFQGKENGYEQIFVYGFNRFIFADFYLRMQDFKHVEPEAHTDSRRPNRAGGGRRGCARD
jgi:hypothetical protein